MRRYNGYAVLLFLLFLPAFIWGWLVWWLIVVGIATLIILWKVISHFIKINWGHKPEPVQILAYKERSRKTYIDKKGYKRYKNNDRLIHRDIAYYKIYRKSFGEYLKKFGEYDIHHKDGNKLNNTIKNLQILTRNEHKKKHGL